MKDNRPVLRGGSWYIDRALARAAYRDWSAPGTRGVSYGFRIAKKYNIPEMAVRGGDWTDTETEQGAPSREFWLARARFTFTGFRVARRTK